MTALIDEWQNVSPRQPLEKEEAGKGRKIGVWHRKQVWQRKGKKSNFSADVCSEGPTGVQSGSNLLLRVNVDVVGKQSY